jgi:hypothetical protein
MSSTLFETTHDLKIASLQRAGEVTDGTSDYDDIVLEQINSLNRSLYAGGNEFDVSLGEAWQWAKAPSPGLLKLEPLLETGTLTLTLDSTSGTLSSAPASSLGSLAGWFIFLSNENIVYRVSAHTAGSTSLTLDQAYMGSTGAKSYKLVKLDYDLSSGIERLVQSLRAFTMTGNDNKPHEISGIEAATFDREFPLVQLREGIPTRFSVINQTNGVYTIRFNSVPDETIRVEYEYIPVAPALVVKTFLDAGVTTGSDLITITDHGFTAGQVVKLTSTGTLPAGLSLYVSYFLVSVTASTFKLSLTRGGSAVDITAAAGGGTHTISVIPQIPHAFRKVLFYAAAHFVLVDKSDSRQDYYLRLTQATLQAMVQANRKMQTHITKAKGVLLARQDSRSSSVNIYDRIPWGTS